MRLKPALFGMAILLAGLHPGTGAHADNGIPRTISVQGTATTQIAPDLVVWHVSVHANHINLNKAKKRSDRQVEAILSSARKFGIEDRDMQTGHLDIRKVYESRQYGPQGNFKHYAIVRGITLVQRNIEMFDPLFTQLLQNNDVEVRYDLTASNLEKVRADTRLQAVNAAKTKAAGMLKELGEKLGPVLEVRENPGTAHNTNRMMLGGTDRSAPGAGDTFAAGVIEVQISVYTTFAIR